MVGEKEAAAESYQVRVRGEAKPVKYSAQELQSVIHQETADKPYRPVPMPIYLADRPQFVG